MLTSVPQPVPEHGVRGETARIYHEIRQTLRVSGVNLNFRTWAAFPEFFTPMWTAMQPVAASQAFESASDRLRVRAADLALTLPPLQVEAQLGDSQRYQLEAALALYHYINPKLLLFTAIVRRGLLEEPEPPDVVTTDLAAAVPFGPSPAMAALEMVEESPDDSRLRRVFADIKATLQLQSINSDYRTLALWPDYLERAWARLKPVVRTQPYATAVTALGREAARLAARFPNPRGIDVHQLAARGVRTGNLVDVVRRFERLLPALILNVALFASDRWPSDRLRRSPFPPVEESHRWRSP